MYEHSRSAKKADSKTADGQATSVRVVINAVLIIFISEAHYRIPHTEFQYVQASADFFSCEGFKLSIIVFHSSLHCSKTALGVHVLDIKAYDGDIISVEIFCLKNSLQIKGVLECVPFEFYGSTSECAFDRF